MEYIYGKLIKEVELAEYKGLSTPSIHVSVDNKNHTISAELLSDIPAGGSSKDSLLVTKQSLTDEEIKQVYSNLNLNEYLNKYTILTNKESQSVSGDFRVNGLLSTKGRYIYVNSNNFPLGEKETAGLLIKNWKNDYDARIYVNSNGELYFSNGNINQQLLTKENMTFGKFTYFNGQALSTKDILPSDINTLNYLPKAGKDLTTKDYVDKSVRQNTNYGIVASYDAFSKVTAWTGRRIHVIECDIEEAESHLTNPITNPIDKEVEAINE